MFDNVVSVLQNKGIEAPKRFGVAGKQTRPRTARRRGKR